MTSADKGLDAYAYAYDSSTEGKISWYSEEMGWQDFHTGRSAAHPEGGASSNVTPIQVPVPLSSVRDTPGPSRSICLPGDDDHAAALYDPNIDTRFAPVSTSEGSTGIKAVKNRPGELAWPHTAFAHDGQPQKEQQNSMNIRWVDAAAIPYGPYNIGAGPGSRVPPQAIVPASTPSATQSSFRHGKTEVTILDEFYRNTPYPSRENVIALAGRTGMTDAQVSSWFNMRRQKDRKDPALRAWLEAAAVASRGRERKVPVKLNEYQTGVLLAVLHVNPRPTMENMTGLARELGLTTQEVKNWCVLIRDLRNFRADGVQLFLRHPNRFDRNR